MFKVKILKIDNENQKQKLSLHMACHGSFLSPANFLFPLPLHIILNIGKSEYKNIPTKGPTTNPDR